VATNRPLCEADVAIPPINGDFQTRATLIITWMGN
jgi:hypothetical protein